MVSIIVRDEVDVGEGVGCSKSTFPGGVIEAVSAREETVADPSPAVIVGTAVALAAEPAVIHRLGSGTVKIVVMKGGDPPMEMKLKLITCWA